jgi:hypothetical protein
MVDLTKLIVSDKLFLDIQLIHSFMPNLLRKSWMVSNAYSLANEMSFESFSLFWSQKVCLEAKIDFFSVLPRCSNLLKNKQSTRFIWVLKYLGYITLKSHLLDDAIRRFAVAALDDAIVQGWNLGPQFQPHQPQ